MAFGFYFAIDALDLALGIDDHGGPERPHRDLAVVLLLAPSAVALQHRRLGVCEQREGEAVFLAEARMAGERVFGDAHDRDPGLFKIR